MFKAIQPSINLWDRKEKYNGWSDWTTWNVALWINNDEGFYNIAKDCKDYLDFLYVHSLHLTEQTGAKRILKK